MFDIVNTHTRAVLITGMQICAGDGTPHNYAVTLNPKPQTPNPTPYTLHPDHYVYALYERPSKMLYLFIARAHACMRVFIFVYVCVHVCMHVCKYACMYVCVCVCVCVCV